MSIENEIRDHMHSTLKELNTKSRDIELVIYFYGFEDNLWPTLDDAANKFNVGDSDRRRSERPRQIINNKFKKLTNLSDLPSLKKFSEHLKSSNFHQPSKLAAYAKDNNLFEDDIKTISALRLLHDLGDCIDYQAYSADLSELTRSAIVSKQEFLIINNSVISNARKALKKAKTIPGLLGIAKLEYLKDTSISNLIAYDDIVATIKLNQDSWIMDKDDQQYYLFESRDNTLINSLEKIKSVADHADIDILSKTLRNSLSRRTPPNNRNYPTVEIIRHYLSSSKYIEMHGSSAVIKLEQQSLTEIEQAAVQYITANDAHSFPEISSHLNSLGYSKPLIDKTVLNSPVIFVDKSQGRSHYNYQLVGNKEPITTSTIDRYEDFRQRLLKVTEDGTDGDQETIRRKEQHILSEWLFKDKESEECAICRKIYSIDSLITAHKKRRSDCAENERTDPNIVMPLCVFGCDYIYEKRLIHIEHNKVTTHGNSSLYSEREYINTIVGKILDSRWTQGSESYFPRPNAGCS